ncbi:MAG: M20 family metallo-hydrolase [Treponema sp.]|jgi:succinyl-diaminopimelate desuccinylase|nr:M20 family metallo-hydrolase [Treponema sp.]
MKDKIFSWIDASAPLAVELETELCKRPAISPESGGEGELAKCEFLETWLKDRGITSLERHDAPDSRAKGGIRPNLIATIHAADKGASNTDRGCLWIMSHLDVVPPGEASLWQGDPWTLRQEERGTRADGSSTGARIIGRGVEDNQQGLVSSVLAVLALINNGIKPARTVKLLFAADEENGSAYGIGWLIGNRPELFSKNDMTLIPDGGDSRGESIEIAEKNLVWAKFSTHGKQAHGSTPDLGANAFLAGSELAWRLHEGLSAAFGDHDSLFDPDYSTFQPTKKETNVPNINTIPGEDIFYMDMRILPRYPVNEVLKEVDRIKGEVEVKHRVKIDYSFNQRMESKPTAADAPFIKMLSKTVAEVYGVKPKPVGIGGGTVGAYLRNEGIDSAVWCRIDDTAHQPNEYALIENILGDAKVMALLMLEN